MHGREELGRAAVVGLTRIRERARRKGSRVAAVCSIWPDTPDKLLENYVVTPVVYFDMSPLFTFYFEIIADVWRIARVVPRAPIDPSADSLIVNISNICQCCFITCYRSVFLFVCLSSFSLNHLGVQYSLTLQCTFPKSNGVF